MEHWKAILTVVFGLCQYCFSVLHNTSYRTQWNAIIVWYWSTIHINWSVLLLYFRLHDVYVHLIWMICFCRPCNFFVIRWHWMPCNFFVIRWHWMPCNFMSSGGFECHAISLSSGGIECHVILCHQVALNAMQFFCHQVAFNAM